MLKAVEAQVEHFLKIADAFYNRKFPRPQVKLDLLERSGIAGQCCYGKRLLRFNQFFLRQRWDDMLADTVPHEVAHWVDFCIRRRSDHSKEWQRIMHFVFDVKPSRCHNYARARRTGITLDDLL